MMTTDERIQAYLDGTLPADETATFERELADPAIAQLFGEELFLRELMRDIGPDVPEGLVQRIAESLSIAPERVERARRMPRLRAALGGAEWMVRGPAYALSGVGGDAFSSARAALPATRSKPKPLWRRALGGLAGARQTVSGVVNAGESLSNASEALSDVGAVLSPLVPRSKESKKPWWRRAVDWVRR